MTGIESADTRASELAEFRREGFTMAFYVAICLIAALTVAGGDPDHTVDVIGIVWGTAIGLALAHWFAFRLSTKLVAGNRFDRTDAQLAGAQLLGAASVAVIATIPILLAPPESELESARLALALTIGLAGFAVARTDGAPVLRSILYGGVILVMALAIALIKNTLAGH